ncbi:MAG: amylo-alpha-1,6-glucosidase, partial [Holophagales bacterium]|nr:amylo-alpha-1,6-glucosidase [Holophagales bacterium]
IQNLSERLPMELLGKFDWKELAELADKNPLALLAELPHLDSSSSGLIEHIRSAMNRTDYPQALLWTPEDLNRVFLVPPDHSVLIRDTYPFEATIKLPGRDFINLRSIPAGGYQIASLPPITGISISEDVRLELNRFAEIHGKRSLGTLRYLSKSPSRQKPRTDVLALLTNGRGAMARFHSDLGRVTSKYDCALGANLHPTSPCDRHIFVKRVRAWVNADGFITPLNSENLIRFHAGPPVSWVFLGHAGDGRAAEIYMTADLMPKSNTLVILFERHDAPPERGMDLPNAASVRLTVRFDLEDRSFHQETKRWDGADDYFYRITTPNQNGFVFKPGSDRQLEAAVDSGAFKMEPEWSLNLRHVIESTRGMTDSGDAWSPGWFDIELHKGKAVHLVITAEKQMPVDWADFKNKRKKALEPFTDLAETLFEQSLMRSLSAYIVERDGGSSVIAGYPWFLDWGRDTLIVCRGMIACGLAKEAGRILITYAALEKNGTLPNMLCADSTANRDTSDAPLWLALASIEAANTLGDKFLQSHLSDGRKLIDALLAIAEGYVAGTPNGIRVDQDSGLVWSPPHFTWMDTNYPAASPREGYPVEIQALWLCLLRLLSKSLPKTKAAKWQTLAKLVESSLEMFWLEAEGYFADVLIAHSGCSAKESIPADHLRPNQLFLISLGLVHGPKAQSAVSAAWRYLLVPGAIRTLAPLPVKTPLPVHAPWGAPLNNPEQPYWGHYEGDEDSRRKPAYHNGTAWVWPLGVFCEALAMAWPNDQAAKNSALAILGSIDQLFSKGCAGHLPEIMDGDAPHTPRGCDAQAWSLSEIIRAEKSIKRATPKTSE